MKRKIISEFQEHYKLNDRVSVFLEPTLYKEHYEELKSICDYIFSNCRELHSLDISNVHAGGISLGGCHNTNPGYIIMNRTFNYDFSDLKAVATDFIREWNLFTKDTLDTFKKFTKECEENGWD